jgi:hypothetical protein
LKDYEFLVQLLVRTLQFTADDIRELGIKEKYELIAEMMGGEENMSLDLAIPNNQVMNVVYFHKRTSGCFG